MADQPIANADPMGSGTGSYPGRAKAFYAAGLLTTAYTLNFLDRQVLAILQEPIKAELHLSDGQLGLLTGFSFALFYVVLGLPVARWADRGVRRDIVALALGLWSLMTALCGLAQNFVQLLLARVGVGVGEAGGSPPAYSMLADIFPPQQRATAFGIYGSGLNIGILAGFLVGGWINEFYGWRIAFLAAGIPGVMLAVVVRTTLSEPYRQQLHNVAGDRDQVPAVKDVLRRLWRFPTFRHMVFGTSLMSFAGYGCFNWLPSLLIRVHGLSTGVVGTWLAIILGIGGALGTFACAYLSDRLARRDLRWYVWVTVGAFMVVIPLMVGAFLASDGITALLWFVIPGALLAIGVPPLMSVTHSLVDNRMRALSSAVVLFILNLLGLGMGPLAVGLLSDALVADHGTESLRYAMLALVPLGAFWGMCHYLIAAKHIRADIDSARSPD